MQRASVECLPCVAPPPQAYPRQVYPTYFSERFPLYISDGGSAQTGWLCCDAAGSGTLSGTYWQQALS
jgi:hypothetical protein